MKRLPLLLLPFLCLVSCSPASRQGTIAELRDVEITIENEETGGGIDRAIESYERFLAEAKGTPLAAEAIRRLADLKVEKDYGLIAETPKAEAGISVAVLAAPEQATRIVTEGATPSPHAAESGAAFERRATATIPVARAADNDRSADNPGLSGAEDAVALYEKLLIQYPNYERNDEVLYQLSRANEELGRVEEAMRVMNLLVDAYPNSRYLDEVQFRRAEYFFTRRHYVDAEEAYASIVSMGETSTFYVLSLYKLGWTYYKQDLHEDALHRFIALLDYMAAHGYDFTAVGDDPDGKRIEDTLRVISLSFSSLGGADAVVDYFAQNGDRPYEDLIYGNLAEYFLVKRRYNDAVSTCAAFISRNPFHRQAPIFAQRVIEVNRAGGFPSLVIAAKKAFATDYALGAGYWRHFNPQERPEVLDGLKGNLTDLANHYHALYQDRRLVGEKAANFSEALRWYRGFLDSFPAEPESSEINYLMADLLLENGAFAEAAREYEKTAYQYPAHAKASNAGYASVYAYRQSLAQVAEEARGPVKREVIRASLKFAETFPGHDKAAIVLAAAADDLYVLRDFETALATARSLLERYPDAAEDVRRSAWMVVAHSSFELSLYPDAEAAYLQILSLLPADSGMRAGLVDNLAASIYKQGEAASRSGDYRTAADHFLRVATLAPTSTIRPAADYDAAAALITLQDWSRAAEVLNNFRAFYPGHELQHEVTKKIAYVYREAGKYALAAAEFERIDGESNDEAVRREALLTAADLYEKVESFDRAAAALRRYVDNFPTPVALNIETRALLAGYFDKQGARDRYLDELRRIVAIEAGAGDAQTEQTRDIAGRAALVLASQDFGLFTAVRLVKPFKENLRRKQALMKTATEAFSKLYAYEVGEVTAAATFHLAEIYADFSLSLMKSERPDKLSALEREQYELALEEQAYPFEEKAIEMHQRNLELLQIGVYNRWVEKSLAKLAVSMPARYAKTELPNNDIATLEGYRFENQTLYRIAQEEAARAADEAAAEKAQAEEAARLAAEQVEATGTEAVQADESQVEQNQANAPREDVKQKGVIQNETRPASGDADTANDDAEPATIDGATGAALDAVEVPSAEGSAPLENPQAASSSDEVPTGGLPTKDAQSPESPTESGRGEGE